MRLPVFEMPRKTTHFLLCFVFCGLVQYTWSQEAGYREEAFKALSSGNYKSSQLYFSRYFHNNNWLGSVEDHVAYAEVLAQVHQSDSAFLHLKKVVGSGRFFDRARITESTHLAPLHRDPRWKPLLRDLRNQTRQERRRYARPLSRRLEKIFCEDQRYRVQMDSVIETYGYPSEAYASLQGKIENADKKNQRYVGNLLRRKGWPTALSPRAHRALFLVIQHGNLIFQRAHEAYIREAYEQGLIDGQDLALFTDRFLMYQDLPQVYGTQLIFNEAAQAWEVYPVREPETLNARRAAVGMAPLEGYPK